MSSIKGPNSPDTLTGIPVLDSDANGGPTEPVSIPLSFNAKRLRICVTLTPEFCTAHANPPEDLVTRAQNRMQTAQAAGQLQFFTVFAQRLNRAWSRMRTLTESKQAPASVVLVLAAGAPELPGLDIKVQTGDKALVLLTITASATHVTSWRPEWVELHVRQALREKGITTKANPVQLAGALIRAQAGQVVRHVKIRPALKLLRPEGKPFQIAVNRARREVSLVIHDLDAVADVEMVNRRLARIEQTIGGMTREQRSGYRVLRQEILEHIHTALIGIESIGLGLPMVLLAAVDARKPKDAAIPELKQKSVMTPPAAASKAPKSAVTTPFLTVAISPDAMNATITRVSPHLSKDPELLPSGDMWFLDELLRAGIVFGGDQAIATEVRTRLSTGESVIGLVVASGERPTGGTEPVLQVVMADGGGEGQKDMRAYHNKTLARSGSLIAEIICKQPGQDGTTVTGTRIPAALSTELPAVQVGEGVEQRGSGGFYATTDGVVMWDGKLLSLEKILVHEGDANMATGDITFGGAVEIKGSIDNGARVRTGGDLIIHGDIRGGSVICGGSLTVARGIVAGSTGIVKANGDIKADFIENSTVQCGGTLTVSRSIMQSRAMAGGSILIVNKSGLLGGGTYVCGQSLMTGNLGLPDGSKTELHVGSDYRTEVSLLLRQSRLDLLMKKSEEDKRTYREITRKTAAQLSKAEKSAKETLRERMTRWPNVLDAARKHLERVSAKQNFKDGVQVFVSGRLSTNCRVRLGGKVIPITKEAVSVVITTTEQDGSYVRPYSGDGDKKVGKGPIGTKDMTAEAPGPSADPESTDSAA